MGGAALLVGVLCTVMVAGVAWACTPQARVVLLSPVSGAVGSEVVLRGEGVPVGPVELRWEGMEGPVLATATADQTGTFSSTFTVPEASAGVYSVVVVAGDAGLGRAAFELTAPDRGVLEAPQVTPWEAGPSARQPAEEAPLAVPLMAGMGLLAFGLLTLFGGAAVAVVARRRLPAASTAARD